MAAYVWLTRDRHLDQLKPALELKRYVTFITLIFIYAFTFYWAGSFFAEQDASWHQVVVRDTSFTPSHIAVFYFSFPLFIIQGVALLLYATTRLPLYAKGVSIPLVMAVVGPFMLLPNVGFNEWGHAFWIMEEYFTVPLHYGFVFFGWAILALGGILVQIMSRLTVLFTQVFGAEDQQARA
jgi:methane/ammonia monooxygenase subunit C